MTIEALRTQLSRKFRGASLDDMQGIENYSVFSEAASNLLSQLDPYETVRMHRFTIFPGVNDYASPVDLKGKKVIDPRPQDNRQGEDFTQTFTKEFDRDKKFTDGKVSVEFIDGEKVLRLSEHRQHGSLTVDQTASDDEWAAAGGATGLEVDEILRLDNSDTLRFDLGAAGGYIEAGVAGTMTPVDISDHNNVSSFFRKIYIPSGASSMTSVSLRLGSSSGSYVTITGELQFGASWRNGVNIVRFDWADGTDTGAPVDFSAVDYERLTFVTTAAIANVQVGPLSSKLPTPYETPYYSNRIFRSTAGTWLETPTSVEDEILLEKEAENIFFYECCIIVAEDLSLDTEAVKFARKLYGDPNKPGDKGGLYGQYSSDKPTEKLPPQVRYIDLRNRRHIRGRTHRLR